MQSYMKVMSDPASGVKVSKTQSKSILEKQKAEDAKIVKAVFEAKEIPGGSVTFPYKKYPGEPVVWYTFQDGVEYEVPLGVVRHVNGVNGSCKYNVHSYIMDSSGNPILSTGRVVHRYGFQSVDFVSTMVKQEVTHEEE